MTEQKTGGTAGEKSPAYLFGLAAAELAFNTRCEDVVLLDLRGRSPVTEFFVLATGTSPRQMRTVVEEVRDLGKKMGFGAWQTSGLESGRWILVDCVTVVCHVFDADGRDFYDLELLWGDCPRIDWRKELGLPEAVVLAAKVGRSEEDEEEGGVHGVADDEGDEDEDEDASVMVELPDESTGSNSVEFVEVDPPGKRKKRGRSIYPTVIEDEEAVEEDRAMHVVSMRGGAEESLDEDDRERSAELEAAKDVEGVSREDLPASGRVPKRKVKAVKKVAGKKAVVKKTAVKKAIGKRVAPKKAGKSVKGKLTGKKKVVKKAVGKVKVVGKKAKKKKK